MPVILSRTGNGVFAMHTIPLYNCHLRITKTVNTVYSTVPCICDKSCSESDSTVQVKSPSLLCSNDEQSTMAATSSDTLLLSSPVSMYRLYEKCTRDNYNGAMHSVVKEKHAHYTLYEASIISQKEKPEMPIEQETRQRTLSRKCENNEAAQAKLCFVIKIRRYKLSEMEFAYSIAETVNSKIQYKILRNFELNCKKDHTSSLEITEEEEEHEEETTSDSNVSNNDDANRKKYEDSCESKDATWRQLLSLLLNVKKNDEVSDRKKGDSITTDDKFTSHKSAVYDQEQDKLNSWQLRVLNTRAVSRFTDRHIALSELRKHFITPELDTINERICFLSSSLHKMFTICRTTTLYLFAQYDKLTRQPPIHEVHVEHDNTVEMESNELEMCAEEEGKQEIHNNNRTVLLRTPTTQILSVDSEQATSESLERLTCTPAAPCKKYESKHDDSYDGLSISMQSSSNAAEAHIMQGNNNDDINTEDNVTNINDYTFRNNSDSCTFDKAVSTYCILNKSNASNDVASIKNSRNGKWTRNSTEDKNKYNQENVNNTVYLENLSPTRRLVYPESCLHSHRARKYKGTLGQVIEHAWTFSALVEQLRYIHVQGKQLNERLECEKGNKSIDLINKEFCKAGGTVQLTSHNMNNKDKDTKNNTNKQTVNRVQEVRGGWCLSLLDLTCEVSLMQSATLLLSLEESNSCNEIEIKDNNAKLTDLKKWLQEGEVAARRVWKCTKSLHALVKIKWERACACTKELQYSKLHCVAPMKYFPYKLFMVLNTSMYLRSLRHLLLCLALQGQLKQSVFTLLLLLEMQNMAEELCEITQQLFVHCESKGIVTTAAAKIQRTECSTNVHKKHPESESNQACDACCSKSIMYSVLLFTVLSLSEVATCLPSSFLQHKANLFGAAVQLLRICNLPEVNNIKKFATSCKIQRTATSTQCTVNNECTRKVDNNHPIDSACCNDNNNIKSEGVNGTNDNNTTNSNCKFILAEINVPESLEKYLSKHDVLHNLMTFTTTSTSKENDMLSSSITNAASTLEQPLTQQEQAFMREQYSQVNWRTIKELSKIANYSVTCPALNSFAAFDIRFKQNMRLFNRVIKHKMYK